MFLNVFHFCVLQRVLILLECLERFLLCFSSVSMFLNVFFYYFVMFVLNVFYVFVRLSVSDHGSPGLVCLMKSMEINSKSIRQRPRLPRAGLLNEILNNKSVRERPRLSKADLLNDINRNQ